MKKLTIKQKMALEYISWFIGENGYSPAITEIQEGLKLKYFNSAFSLVSALENKGYISSIYGKTRTIKVLRGDMNEKT